MDNYLIRYDNCINSMFPTDLTKLEMNAFMYILSCFHGDSSDEIAISYDQIRSVIRYNPRRTAKEFDEALERLCDKLRRIEISSGCEEEVSDLCLFPSFIRNWYRRTLTVGINPRARHLVSVSKGYTQFDIREYISLKSKGAKFIYINLKQFRTTGVWHVLMDDFKCRLGVTNYSNNNCIQKIINPAVEELIAKEMFFDLNVTVEYDHTQGRPVRTLLFTFRPEARKEKTPSDDDYSLKKQEIVPKESEIPHSDIPEEEIDSIYCTAEAMIGGMVCEKDIVCISHVARRCNLSAVELKRCINDALGRDNVKNFVGYLITLIRKCRSKGSLRVSDIRSGVPYAKSRYTGDFYSFNQRAYDYAALERELLA